VGVAANTPERVKMPRLGAAVRAYLGLPGAGKTYAMTAHAIAVRKRYPTLRVYANYDVRMPGAGEVLQLETVEDFEAARDGLVLLDEAHALLGSREWAGRDRQRVLVKLGQMRKARLFFWYTTHSAGKVDKQLRLLTEESRSMVSFRTLARGFFYRARAGVERDAEALGVGFVLFRKSVAQAYDTMGSVDTGGLARSRVSG